MLSIQKQMKNEIKFKKSRIFLAAIFVTAMFATSISFLLTPEIYLRNVFSTVRKIQIIGTIIFIYSSALLYSLVRISTRKYAIRITDEFLIDNSKYESLGEIKWKDIFKIQRLKKNNIEVFLNPTVFKTKKSNLLKRFLRFMHNWNYKKSILISSAALDCSIEELFKIISTAYKNNK